MALAIRTAADPTPPLAPVTSRRSPGWRRPRPMAACQTELGLGVGAGLGVGVWAERVSAHPAAPYPLPVLVQVPNVHMIEAASTAVKPLGTGTNADVSQTM